MTLVSFIHPAGPGHFYSEGVADHLVGTTFEAKVEGVSIGEGKVVRAEVVQDGHALELIVEWPEETAVV